MTTRTRDTAAAADPILHGQKLALQMLEELEAVGPGQSGPADACDIEWTHVHDIPFRNVVLEYLLRARAQGDAVEYGFTALLSHALSIGSGGFGICSNSMAQTVKRFRLHYQPGAMT
jgi:hypothetical protein